MESIVKNNNKELEDFIEGDYTSIREGESKTLEFDINKAWWTGLILMAIP